jgi:hypothetical protein
VIILIEPQKKKREAMKLEHLYNRAHPFKPYVTLVDTNVDSDSEKSPPSFYLFFIREYLGPAFLHLVRSFIVTVHIHTYTNTHTERERERKMGTMKLGEKLTCL